jgi:hypothetical protein
MSVTPDSSLSVCDVRQMRKTTSRPTMPPARPRGRIVEDLGDATVLDPTVHERDSVFLVQR